MVTDPSGNNLYSLNADKLMVPASTLKIVTSAAALKTLGSNYRFKTEFRLSRKNDLYVIGYGDPFLISEELAYIVQQLKARGLTAVGNIFLDNLYFKKGLVLDGTERSLNPYDAYNGALCVNFNTIYVKITRQKKVFSAEPQTPLTELARKLALESGARGKTRINLSKNPDICLEYAGELLKVFLEQAGVKVQGRILPSGGGNPALLLYEHKARKPLDQLVTELFKYSNNFMTNQIFLAMGAERYGPPADEVKARRVVWDYLKSEGIPLFHMEEGSGLSRRTKLTAAQLTAVLHRFKPYRRLLVKDDNVLYKTGTLSDVKSMAGYIERPGAEPLTFVILLNGSYKWDTREKILALLNDNLI